MTLGGLIRTRSLGIEWSRYLASCGRYAKKTEPQFLMLTRSFLFERSSLKTRPATPPEAKRNFNTVSSDSLLQP